MLLAEVAGPGSHTCGPGGLGTKRLIPAFVDMRLPPRRAVKGFKEPASHRDVFVMVCGGIDQIANDRRTHPEQIRAELMALKQKCEFHLGGLISEALTGNDLANQGLRIHDKKRIR